MNKKELIKAASLQSDLSLKVTEEVLGSIVSVIRDTLHAEEPVSIQGLGTFAVRERAPRRGFNPRTRTVTQIEASKIVKFIPSQALNPKEDPKIFGIALQQ